MSINRRTAIRQLAFISAGAALLPACFNDPGAGKISLKNFTIDPDGARLLDELTATLIPTTDTPGAREAGADVFVLKMMDDCASADAQKEYLRGLRQFDAAAKAANGKNFVHCGPAERQSFLSAVEAGKMPDADLHSFYSATKRLTILAYTSSSFYLTKVRVYKLVPGPWHGCVAVKATGGLAS